MAIKRAAPTPRQRGGNALVFPSPSQIKAGGHFVTCVGVAGARRGCCYGPWQLTQWKQIASVALQLSITP